jgi:hypothetical protein
MEFSHRIARWGCHSMAAASLMKAIEKLAVAGEEAGLSVEQMIEMLNGGVSVETLIELIELISCRLDLLQNSKRSVLSSVRWVM